MSEIGQLPFTVDRVPQGKLLPQDGIGLLIWCRRLMDE